MSLFQRIKAFVWSKHFLKHTAFLLLTYIIIIGGTSIYLDFYTHNGEKIEVPNLVGKKFAAANVVAEELDLKIELLDSVYRPDLPAGTIVSQDPGASRQTDVYVKSGRIIRVQLSKRTRLVEMPSLIDKSERFAESVLKNRGLKYRIEYRSTREANGAVLDQLYKGDKIKEGRRIPIGSTITIIVGRNEAGVPVEIPNLVGLTISEARGRLLGTSLHFMLTCPDCENAADSSSAIVTSQSPEFLEGSMAPAGTTVNVSASKSGE